MTRSIRTSTFLLAALALSGVAFAQTSSAPTSTAPAGQTPAAKKPAAKPGTTTTTKPAAVPPVLKTDKDKQSYAIGMSIAKTLKGQDLDVDTSLLVRGLRDELNGAKPALTDEEAQAVLTTMQADMRKRLEAKAAAAAETNKKEGDAFLAANKTKPGVVTTASGLQYKILQPGTGPRPTVNDTVVCNYKGTLLDGKEFDSSYKRGQPATFAVGQIIKGWTEALQLMPVGSKYELFIPPDLAYGARQAGPDIGPNSTLIFEVELVSIKPKDAGAGASGPGGAAAAPGNPDQPKQATPPPSDPAAPTKP